MKSGQSSLLVFICCLLKSYYCYLSDEEIYAFFIPRNTSVFGSEHTGKHIYPVTNELKCEQFQVSRVFLLSGCCQRGWWQCVSSTSQVAGAYPKGSQLWTTLWGREPEPDSSVCQPERLCRDLPLLAHRWTVVEVPSFWVTRTGCCNDEHPFLTGFCVPSEVHTGIFFPDAGAASF